MVKRLTKSGDVQANVRLVEADQKLMKALQAHLGVRSVSDVIRQALRALAAKEGVTV